MYAQSSSLDSGERGLLNSLHSGAFISDDMKAKFDVTKTHCPVCHVADSVMHWFDCPRKAELRSSIPTWPTDLSEQPVSVKQHLLCPRNPWLCAWWLALSALPDDAAVFEAVEPISPHRLFTDGSCHRGPVSAYNTCSWSVTSASAGMVLSAGWLPGLTQSIPRAEVTAVLSALTWLSRVRVTAFLWIDSKHTVENAWYLLEHLTVPSHWANRDLWQQICDLLTDLQDIPPTFRWWPSHMSQLSCSDCFHDWARKWNNAVDLQAGIVNRALPRHLADLQRKAAAFHDSTLSRSQPLFKFFCAVHEATSTGASAAGSHAAPLEPVHASEPERDSFLVSCIDRLPPFWTDSLPEIPSPGSQLFLREIITRLVGCGDRDFGLYAMSWVELVFLLVRELDLPLPHYVSSRNVFELIPVHSHFTRPLMTGVLRTVRNTLRIFCRSFGFEDLLFEGKDRSDLGIFFPVGGLFISISPVTVDLVAGLVRSWTHSRPLRRACDVARPF